MDPALSLRAPLEVLDRVGHVHVVALDTGCDEPFVENPARGADERPAREVFGVTRLLADEHRPRPRAALAEDCLGRLAPELAVPARRGLLTERGQGSHE